MSDMNDIARIGYVISNFDDITWNGETSYNHIDENGNPSPMVQFSKRIDGTIYVVQTVSEVKSMSYDPQETPEAWLDITAFTYSITSEKEKTTMKFDFCIGKNKVMNNSRKIISINERYFWEFYFYG